MDKAERFYKYDQSYDGPPDTEASRLIRLAMHGGDALRDKHNAALLEHYVERGYVEDDAIARAVATHLRRKADWQNGLMSENMVYEPLRAVGLI